MKRGKLYLLMAVMVLMIVDMRVGESKDGGRHERDRAHWTSTIKLHTAPYAIQHANQNQNQNPPPIPHPPRVSSSDCCLSFLCVAYFFQSSVRVQPFLRIHFPMSAMAKQMRTIKLSVQSVVIHSFKSDPVMPYSMHVVIRSSYIHYRDRRICLTASPTRLVSITSV